MPDFSKLNEIQLKAVTWGEGPLLLLAGPGSGKTTVIVNRISHLLSMGVSPETILVITFTKDAALSMQQRFHNSTENNPPVNFGTFHAVFYHIYSEATKPVKWSLISLPKKQIILNSLLHNLFPNSDNLITTECIEGILNAIGYYKNTGNLERAISSLQEPVKSRFVQIFESYRNEMLKKSMMDFDDMLYECRELLRNNKKLRKELQQKYRYILVDEFQDINPMQYDVLKLLAPEGSNLFAVGDDDQSIYSFRGASPGIMQDFKAFYNADILQLNVNYRSTAAIVNASAGLIGKNQQRFVKHPTAQKTQVLNSIKVLGFDEKKEQYAFLFRQLEFFIKHNKDRNKTVAVLFRTNLYLQTTAARLSARDIPFAVKDVQKNLYDHFIAKDICAYMELAEGKWNRQELVTILNRPVRFVSREALANSDSLEELIDFYRQNKDYHRKYTDVVADLYKLRTHLDEMHKLQPGTAVVYIMKAIGYERHLISLAGGDEKKLEEWMYLLNWLKEDAHRFKSYAEWKEAQKIYRQKLSERIRHKSEKKESIQLMTIHGAKGLEFDTVYIPDCIEKMYPHGDSLSKEEVEEERRIFYVAVTRAKEEVFITYTKGTAARPTVPSRFVAELG